MASRPLVIIDIGCHKLEELLVLLGPYRRQLGIYVWWLIKRTGKAVLTLNFRRFLGLGRQLRVIRYYFLSRRRYDIQVVAVEPNAAVVVPYVEKIRCAYPVHLMPVAVLGHDASAKAELKTLHFYDHSISSSIYRKGDRPTNEARALTCVGLTFDVIWDGLVKEGVIGKDAPFLLRMNCEGAELGVIETCSSRGLKPACIIGSIADMDKIHGQASGDKTRRLMQDMGAPYFYFKGDDPGTWHDMIDVWEKYTTAYRK